MQRFLCLGDFPVEGLLVETAHDVGDKPERLEEAADSVEDMDGDSSSKGFDGIEGVRAGASVTEGLVDGLSLVLNNVDGAGIEGVDGAEGVELLEDVESACVKGFEGVEGEVIDNIEGMGDSGARIEGEGVEGNGVKGVEEGE